MTINFHTWRATLAATALLTLTACGEIELPDQPVTDTPTQTDKTRKFTFTVKGDFSDTWSSRATTYLQADGKEMTDLWVLDIVDGNVVQQLHQSPTDTDWGKPSLSLTLGDHHIAFCASRSDTPVLDGTRLSWTKHRDTFYCDYPVTVTATSNGNRAVTLDRITTQCRITIDDAIPSGMTELRFTPATYYCGIDLADGTLLPATATMTSALYESDYGKSGITFIAAWLAPAEEYTTSVTIAAYKGDTKHSEVTAADLKFLRNRKTLTHGTLFGAALQSGLSLNATWLTDYDGGKW